MDDRVIPARRVLALLRDRAEHTGLNASILGLTIVIMCAACYPHQPERLEFSARRVRPLRGRKGDAPWDQVLLEECDGFARIRFPRTLRDGRALILVADAVEALSVETCCHGGGDALGSWDWRSDLRAAIDTAVESEGGGWNEEWERLTAARERVRAQEASAYTAIALGNALPPRLRVQAFASVLKDAGRPVAVEQARVSWECGHSDADGRWLRVSYVLDPNRGMIPAHDTCGLHGEDGTDFDALAVEYQRVAEMSDDERAAYQPVKETKKRGPWPSRGGGGSKPRSAPRGDEWPPDRTRAWCIEKNLDLTFGIQRLFTTVCAVEPDESKRPPRMAIYRMKNAERPG